MKTRGLLMMAWGREGYFLKAEKRGLDISERLGLPLAIITDTEFGGRTDISYIRTDFAGFEKNEKRRKSLMGELSPFKQTLYLDTDVVLVDPQLSYAWRLLEQEGGLVLAIGRSVIGSVRFSNHGLEHSATYHNTGVMFFDKGKTKALFEEWKTLCLRDQSRFADEYLLNALLYENNYPVASLPPSWNLRTAEPYPFLKHLKLWHSRESIPNCVKSE